MSDVNSIQSVLSQRLHSGASSDSATHVRILEKPESLENRENRPQRLRGEVSHKEKDGTLHIKTEHGTIKAKIEGDSTPINEGDIVDIKIDTRTTQTIETASLRPATKQSLSPPVTLPESAVIIRNIPVPAAVTPTELVNGAPIQVEPVSATAVQTLAQPFIEVLSTASLADIDFTAPLQLSPFIDLPLNDQILESSPFSAPIDSADVFNLKNSEQSILTPKSSPETASNTLEPPITTISLASLMAQIIKSPLLAPIEINAQTLETQPHSQITEIDVLSITHPNIQISQINENTPDEAASEDKQAGSTQAVLIGFTQDKHFPVIKITSPNNHKDSYYALQIPVTDMPVGAQISLDITQSIPAVISSPALSAHIMPAPALPLAFAPETWPALQELAQVLTDINPQAAQIFHASVPNAASPAQIKPTALFFLAAIRSGDLQNWLGEKTIDTLKRAGKSDLLNRLSGDLSNISRQSVDNAGQEWRSLSMPMAWQNEIHKITLHYRKENEDSTKEEQNKGGKTRFIMNLSLTHIGNIQIDGLFIGNPDAVGRLDLILRTTQGFSQPMKQQMRDIFKNALEETNFTGELSFQDKHEHWVHISEDIKSKYSESV